MRRAIVLLAHGSPDPDWHRPVSATADALRQRVRDTVAIATLLGSELEDAVARLLDDGHDTVVVMALFLSAGGRHVKRDIPHRVAQLAAAYPHARIGVTDGALGEDPAVAEALAEAAARSLDSDSVS